MGVTLPLTEVADIGEKPSSIYRFVARELKEKPELIPAGVFHRVLFSRRGKLVGSFDASVPTSDVLKHVIAELNTTK